MGKKVDATGEINNYCKALYPTEKRSASGGVIWVFEYLRCGKIFENSINSVRQNYVKSCGCLSKLHGDSGTRLHTIWCDMKQRCRETTNKWYGSQGIKVCNEWNNSYITFKEWALKNGYNDMLSIDRIDPYGDYCPENCRWATPSEQCKNRRDSLVIYQNNIKIHVLDFLKTYGIITDTGNFGRDYKSADIPLYLYVAYRIANKEKRIRRIRRVSNFKNEQLIHFLEKEAKILNISDKDTKKVIA